MTELCWLTVAEAARMMRAKTLSPVDYAKALLERVGRLDRHTNAFIKVDAERALADARAAEAAFAAGQDRGPLHGIPYALKDIIDYGGEVTTAHSKILLANRAAADAFVTTRLKAAGGIYMGKLSTHEFAIGGPAFDLPFPPARNPWNVKHHPGGSSSGSGSAVGAGYVPMALGTDTGGSVRNPASMCGIVGLKPTYGRVSRAGVVPLSFSLDHVGPMTRTVEDNALMLAAIAGHDPADPGSAARASEDFTREMNKGVKGLKIGLIRHFYTKDLIADAEMAAGVDKAAETLRALGAELREISTVPLSEWAAVNRVMLLSEACSIHEKWLKERPGDYASMTRRRLLPGMFFSAVDYMQASRRRRQIVAELDAHFADVDVIVTASSMETAAEITDTPLVEKTYPRQARTPFNVSGHPALALGCGFHSNGLPLAFQIVGRSFDEATVYRVGHAYQQATDWHTRRPALPQG